ncbi:hypothetical protein B0H12DRAFT_296156 [Mycena haematopus]|nr:hypothetical protein B0H12DRAFT_296156 [Mycena haematopus]
MGSYCPPAGSLDIERFGAPVPRIPFFTVDGDHARPMRPSHWMYRKEEVPRWEEGRTMETPEASVLPRTEGNSNHQKDDKGKAKAGEADEEMSFENVMEADDEDILEVDAEPARQPPSNVITLEGLDASLSTVMFRELAADHFYRGRATPRAMLRGQGLMWLRFEDVTLGRRAFGALSNVAPGVTVAFRTDAEFDDAANYTQDLWNMDVMTMEDDSAPPAYQPLVPEVNAPQLDAAPLPLAAIQQPETSAARGNLWEESLPFPELQALRLESSSCTSTPHERQPLAPEALQRTKDGTSASTFSSEPANSANGVSTLTQKRTCLTGTEGPGESTSMLEDVAATPDLLARVPDPATRTRPQQRDHSPPHAPRAMREAEAALSRVHLGDRVSDWRVDWNGLINRKRPLEERMTEARPPRSLAQRLTRPLPFRMMSAQQPQSSRLPFPPRPLAERIRPPSPPTDSETHLFKKGLTDALPHTDAAQVSQGQRRKPARRSKRAGRETQEQHRLRVQQRIEAARTEGVEPSSSTIKAVAQAFAPVASTFFSPVQLVGLTSSEIPIGSTSAVTDKGEEELEDTNTGETWADGDDDRMGPC